MTLSRTKLAGWASNELLTSAQMDAVDQNIEGALDKRSGQIDGLASVVQCTGTGRLVPSKITGANAAHTYQPGDASQIVVDATVTADRTYRFGSTNSVDGDRILVFCTTTFAHEITVKDDNSGDTLFVIGNQSTSDGPAIELVWHDDDSTWVAAAPVPSLRIADFTSSGTWTCPQGVFAVTLWGHGGGGGGGGGHAGTSGTNHFATGGGGGGGAMASSITLPVVPTTVYTVNIGAGGVGSTGVGGSGGQTQFYDGGFVVSAYFEGAGGGQDGLLDSSAPYATVVYGGVSTTPAADSIINVLASAASPAIFQKHPGDGGATVSNGLTTAAMKKGMANVSASGGVGGTGGSDGSNTGDPYYGGSGGGGGGAGPRGSGATGGNGGNADATTGVNGTAGSNASANTGAGGGGGGGGGSAGTTGGSGASGGNGGSGFLRLVYVK